MLATTGLLALTSNPNDSAAEAHVSPLLDQHDVEVTATSRP